MTDKVIEAVARAIYGPDCSMLDWQVRTAEQALTAADRARAEDADDLEKRLRGSVCYASTAREWPNVLLDEAADTIAALRAENERLRVSRLEEMSEATRFASELSEAEAENERLRGLLRESGTAFIYAKPRAGTEWGDVVFALLARINAELGKGGSE